MRIPASLAVSAETKIDIAAVVQQQARRHFWLLVTAYIPVLVLLAAVAAAKIVGGIDVGDMTRDAIAVLDGEWYIGMVSAVGGLAWAAAAAICLFTFAFVRSAQHSTVRARFFLAGGLLTAVLMLDDVFLLHEVVFHIHLGIDEKIVYVAYLFAIGAFLWFFRDTIARTSFLLLGVALAFFGVSIAIDAVETVFPLPGVYLFEDGAKLFGIVTWAMYFAVVAGTQLRPEQPPQAAARAV